MNNKKYTPRIYAPPENNLMDNLTPYDKYASGDYLLHNIRIFLHAGAKVAIFPETTKFFPIFLSTELRSHRVFASVFNHYTLCSILFIFNIRSGTLLRTASTTSLN